MRFLARYRPLYGLGLPKMVEMTVLQTITLTLRPYNPSDRADFIGLEVDPEVMSFLNGGAVDHENTDPEDVTFLMPRGSEPYVWTTRRAGQPFDELHSRGRSIIRWA